MRELLRLGRRDLGRGDLDHIVTWGRTTRRRSWPARQPAAQRAHQKRDREGGEHANDDERSRGERENRQSGGDENLEHAGEQSALR